MTTTYGRLCDWEYVERAFESLDENMPAWSQIVVTNVGYAYLQSRWHFCPDDGDERDMTYFGVFST